jgi:hypothetical protein
VDFQSREWNGAFGLAARVGERGNGHTLEHLCRGEIEGKSPTPHKWQAVGRFIPRS